MVDYEVLDDKKLQLTFLNHWHGVVYKPYFYRRLKELKQVETKEAFDALVKEIESKKGWEYACYLLAKRSYSSGELKEKLEGKFLSDETISSILNRCQERGYLDDQSVILAHIRKELHKGYGPKVFISKLTYKLKVERGDVEEIFLSQITDDELLEYKEKWIRKKKEKDPYKMRSLLYKRGF